MANENLKINISTTGAGKAAKDFDRVAGSMQKTAKRSGAANQAIINLGRGVSDARFGFHGLANNLEFVVEMLGQTSIDAKKTGSSIGKNLVGSLLGPAGLVAGISILIAYGPEIYDFFKKQFEQPALDVADAIEEVNKQVENLSVEEYFAKLQSENRDNIDQLKKDLASLDEKQAIAVGKGSFIKDYEERRKVITDALDAAIDFDNQLIDGMQNQAKAIQDANKEAREYKKTLEKLRDSEDIAIFAPETGLEAEDPYKTGLGIFGGNLQNLFGTLPEPEVIDEDSADEDLDNLLASIGSPLAGLSDEEVDKFLENAQKVQDKAKELGESVSSAFEDLGNNIANSLAASHGVLGAFLGTMAQALTKYLGEYASYLIQKSAMDATAAGTSAVAGATTAAAATGPAFPITLPVFIAAALAAVASAMSGVGGKAKTGGGAGRSTSGTTGRRGTPRPTVTDAGTVAVAKVKGQDLILALENANYSRQGYYGV